MSMRQLGHGVKLAAYATSSDHLYLDEDSGRPEGANIGLNGEHLTISFLSMNRSSLSIKLCQSIADQMPGFKGEVLVVDNGSAAEEIRTLERFLAGMPYRWRIIELGQNFGVAGGRNRTMAHVETKWLMTLDNDIYLISNPLSRIQRDLATLGCHFMSLLLLAEDAKTTQIHGGNIYLSRLHDSLVIGCGSAYLPEEVREDMPPGFLGTFLPGGAAVFRCDSFLALGGYDEGMFVGFEDVEFSLRLFRSGMKVGASTVPAFVHDHPPPSTEGDKDYERSRFARRRLEASAAHFEAKHGYKVWHLGVDTWLQTRERELGLSDCRSDSTEQVLLHAGPGRKRIQLVVDSFGWALSNVADQICAHLSDEFDFDVISSSDATHPALLLQMSRDADLVHFLWREPLHGLLQDRDSHYIELAMGGWDEFRRRCIDVRPITATVFDHLYLSDEDLKARYPLYSELLHSYTVSSEKLMQAYCSVPGYPPPLCVTQDGVALERFRPSRLERFGEIGSRALRVGWAGNSAFGFWSEQGARDDLKGFHSVLKPAIESLRARGYKIDEHFADKQIRFIPHHRMADYYQEIDVLVCCSLSEGTPNPVLEAMACGVPVISTDVGVVPEVFGPLQREFMMAERSVAGLEEMLRALIEDPGRLHALSAENLQQIQSWGWEAKAQRYRQFFRAVLTKQPVLGSAGALAEDASAPDRTGR